MAKKVKRNDETTISVITHILGLFTWFIGPLVIFLASNNKEVKRHAKNALNWQISFAVYMLASFILMLVLIGFILVPLFSVLNIIFCIIAAIRASEGKMWKYPFSIKFLKN